MGKRTLEEMVSKEDKTMQDSVVHGNADGNDGGAKQSTVSDNNNVPMVRRSFV